MERLTDNTEYCTSWSDCEMSEGKCVFIENCYDRKLYNKLREYEDAEEQVLNATGADLKSMIGEFMHYYNLQKEGRLKELPCKIGDIVYEANKYWSEVIPRTVASIAFYKNSIWLRDGCGDSFEYGIEAFLTMEEAEKALEEMEKK